MIVPDAFYVHQVILAQVEKNVLAQQIRALFVVALVQTAIYALLKELLFLFNVNQEPQLIIKEPIVSNAYPAILHRLLEDNVPVRQIQQMFAVNHALAAMSVQLNLL